MSDDHKIIYLEPECCVDESEGRTWCQDNVYDTDFEDDGVIVHPTAYIRKDLFDSNVKRIEELEEEIKDLLSTRTEMEDSK